MVPGAQRRGRAAQDGGGGGGGEGKNCGEESSMGMKEGMAGWGAVPSAPQCAVGGRYRAGGLRAAPHVSLSVSPRRNTIKARW